MPKIIFVEHSGEKHEINCESGKSIMLAAVENLIPGIVGDCGGCCSCATCHAYIDEKWHQKIDVADEGETMMLDAVMWPKSNSRLTCQVVMRDEFDGMVVRIPESQY